MTYKIILVNLLVNILRPITFVNKLVYSLYSLLHVNCYN